MSDADQILKAIGVNDPAAPRTHEIHFRDPVDTAREGLNRAYRRRLDKVIGHELGIQFRGTAQVTIKQPRWMPGPLWRWLWRQVVLATGPVEQVKRSAK